MQTFLLTSTAETFPVGYLQNKSVELSLRCYLINREEDNFFRSLNFILPNTKFLSGNTSPDEENGY